MRAPEFLLVGLLLGALLGVESFTRARRGLSLVSPAVAVLLGLLLGLVPLALLVGCSAGAEPGPAGVECVPGAVCIGWGSDGGAGRVVCVVTDAGVRRECAP